MTGGLVVVVVVAVSLSCFTSAVVVAGGVTVATVSVTVSADTGCASALLAAGVVGTVVVEEVVAVSANTGCASTLLAAGVVSPVVVEDVFAAAFVNQFARVACLPAFDCWGCILLYGALGYELCAQENNDILCSRDFAPKFCDKECKAMGSLPQGSERNFLLWF